MKPELEPLDVPSVDAILEGYNPRSVLTPV